jgi:hypothetical protein
MIHLSHISKFFNRFIQWVTILALTFFSFLVSGHTQVIKDAINRQTIIQSSNSIEINNPAKIDKRLLIKFPAWKKMFASNGKFNATDVGNGPNRRVIFIAKADSNWIISYQHGGTGYYTHCFLITFNDQHNLLIQNSPGKFESLEDLKLFLKTIRAMK